MSGRGDGRSTGSGDDRAPLDGAFLLQLLRRPPKPQHQPTAPPPPPPIHYEVRQPHQNPRNAGFSPHNFVPPHRPSPPPEPYSDPHLFPPPSRPAFHHVPTNPTGFPNPRSNYQNSHIPASRPIFTHSPPPRNDYRGDRWNPRGEGFSHDSQNFYSSRTSGSLRSGERTPPNPNIGFQKAMGERTPPNPNIGFQKAMEGSFARTSSGSVTGMNSGFRPIGPSRGPFERNHPHSETSSGPGRHEAFPRFGMVGNGQRNPTGPVSKPKGPGEWVASKGKQDGGSQNVEKGEYIHSKETDRFNGEVKEPTLVLNHRLNRSRDASVSNLHEVVHCEEFLNESESLSEAVEGTVAIVHKHVKHVRVDDFAFGEGSCKMDALSEQLMDSLNSLNHQDDNVDKKVKDFNTRRAKDLRSDSLRGLQVSSQRIRIRRRGTQCRHDIESLAPSFLSIYVSLIPADEEIARQKQLLLSLRKLVSQEWPNAQLHLYGSCANSFGVSKSDIDICLAIDDTDLTKSDILLRLADILLSNNLQNVQALTRARVPIVKMMDPVTGISCDICINNLLAVVNSKLLRDYARIDERLRQLAFIVKHWAKSRGVNETYRGTLSSYAYVLMCIHFLQRRNPAILPCLQEMKATYVVTVDDTECSYFDQVEELIDFGVRNKENVAQLLWAFFHYWAYFHDFMDDVISVRTGHIIRKVEKDWTRRVGFDRHLICIEDPFETSHDLGRVVDKFTIKILREEFERAAYILQYDPNPSVTLFEPYVPRLMTQD